MAAIPERFHNAEHAARLDPELTERLARNLTVGDAPADAVIDVLLSARDAAPLKRGLDRALGGERGGLADLPRELRDYAELLDEVPAWVDPEALATGARAYQRLGLASAVILAGVSLMRGYHSAAVNKPLVYAGRLTGRAQRRLAETSRYVQAVSRVGGLDVGAPGRLITARVRLMHAKVRRLLLDSGRWSVATWGVPINQSDIAATGLSFSAAVLFASRRLGFRFSLDESESLLHLWRYASHLMGLAPELSWRNEREAVRLGVLIDMTQPGADEYSEQLASAARGAILRRADGSLPAGPAWLMQRYFDAMIRALNGDVVADDLGVPEGGRWALPLTRVFVSTSELLRQHVPGVAGALEWVGRRSVGEQIALRIGVEPALFELPEALGAATQLEDLPGRGAPPRSRRLRPSELYDDVRTWVDGEVRLMRLAARRARALISRPRAALRRPR